VEVEVFGTDADGEALARPRQWPGSTPPPLVLMEPERRDQPALTPGERVLARLRPLGGGRFAGRTLRRLDATPGQVIGVFRATDSGGRIVPTDRRAKAAWLVPGNATASAADGELVRATPLPSAPFGGKSAAVVERLGRLDDPGAHSLVIVHTHGLPSGFSPQARAEASAAGPPTAEGRTDLRAIPLLTIDGADARDFDDAVFAERVAGGFRLLVAIADVAAYVRPGSALDAAARERGNSVYFPDRVLPMLPEPLSAGWCSLRPGLDRACLFVDIEIDAAGRKRRHRFGRGLMRSAARLTYEQAEAGRDAATAPPALPALYAVSEALLAARAARGTLDLELPERQVVLAADGSVQRVDVRPRLASQRLIEECMLLANVCAAEELEQRRLPAVWRVHAPPSPEKLAALRALLRVWDVTLPTEGPLRAGDLQRALDRLAGGEAAAAAAEVMLRAQSQAAYAVENIGHFGLALPRYVHFTSPIRRYADLLVHRALIRGLELGSDGLTDAELPTLAACAAAISASERRAATAEREAVDRVLAVFMADHIGSVFPARISHVTRFGLFVTLEQSGASGFVPVTSLGDDYWQFDAATQTLAGRRRGKVWHLAEPVAARLVAANCVTGGLTFHLAANGAAGRHTRGRSGRK
jgi:ribonuclease R